MAPTLAPQVAKTNAGSSCITIGFTKACLFRLAAALNANPKTKGADTKTQGADPKTHGANPKTHPSLLLQRIACLLACLLACLFRFAAAMNATPKTQGADPKTQGADPNPHSANPKTMPEPAFNKSLLVQVGRRSERKS